MKTIYSFAIITVLTLGCTDPLPEESTPKTETQKKSKEKHGLVETFREDGSQIAKVNYVHGSREGVSYNYYPNGNVKLEINYKENKKEGVAKWFYESGKLYMETNYVGGKKNGIEKRFFESGVLQAEIPYNLDKLCVGTKEYNSSGKLIEKKHTMQIDVSNTVSLDGRLTYKVYMPKTKNVEFFVSEHMMDGDCLSEFAGAGLETPDGSLEHSLVIPPNSSFIGTLIVYAKYKSYRKIPHLVKGEKRFAIDN